MSTPPHRTMRSTDDRGLRAPFSRGLIQTPVGGGMPAGRRRGGGYSRFGHNQNGRGEGVVPTAGGYGAGADHDGLESGGRWLRQGDSRQGLVAIAQQQCVEAVEVDTCPAEQLV